MKTFISDVRFGIDDCWIINEDDEHVLHYTLTDDISNNTSSVIEEYQNIFRAYDDLVICMSGGIDSEVLAQSCLMGSIPFTVAIMRLYCDDIIWNHHDYKYAVEFCENNNIVYKFYDLDCRTFYDGGEFLHYAIEYECISPQICAHLWLLNQIEGTPVMGDDYPTIQHNGKLEMFITSFNTCHYEIFLHKNNRAGICKPSCFNSKIIQSYLKLQQDCAHIQCVSHYTQKTFIYKMAGFDFSLRSANFTGFEYIRMHYTLLANEKNTFREFNNRFRKPLIELNDYRKGSVYHLSPDLQMMFDKYTTLLQDKKNVKLFRDLDDALANIDR